MGNPSMLCFVPADSATVQIDWSKVPEASKQYLINSWELEALPATISELANVFNESKFFGYIDSERSTLLFDISEFGLSAPPVIGQTFPVQLCPRFYMMCTEEMWCLIFIPGKRDGITAWSPTIRELREENFENYGEYVTANVAQEIEIAQKFDAQLKQRTLYSEVSNLLKLYAEIAGWQAMSLKQNLEYHQLMEAMLSLPPDHPAFKAYSDRVFAILKR